MATSQSKATNDLGAFQQHPQCNKCGGQRIETKFCRGGQHPFSDGAKCDIQIEHLHRRCKICEYIWTTRCMNGKQRARVA